MRGGASADAGNPTTYVGPLVVAGAVLAYTLSLRRFGLDLVDEGTLLAQFAAVARGGIPYRDFQSGYGPLGFYWNAAVLRGLGGDLVAVRTVLAAVHATSASLLYAIARRAGGRGIAAAAIVLVWGMLRPVASGAFATFNVPYPSWLAEALGYAAVLLVLGGGGRAGRVAAAGALWGLAFLAKQNAGVFGLAGTLVYLALRDPERGSVAPRWPGVLLAAAVALGVAGLAGAGGMTGWEAALLGAPMVLLAVAAARARPSAALVGRGALLGAGFVAIVAPALVLLAARVGWGVVVHEVLRLGSAEAVQFRLPYPTPAALAADAWRAGSGWLGIGRRLVDDLWMIALPAAAVVGACRLAMRPQGGRDARVALVAVGAPLYLQLYPRADAWHVLPAAGLLVTLGLCLLADALRRRTAVVVGASIAVAALRSAPTVPVVAAMYAPPPASEAVVPHATIRWDLVRGDYLVRIPEVAAALAGVRSLFGFPALAFFNFVTDAPSPVRHEYFFPGHPSPDEVTAMLAELEASPPQAIVVLDAPVAFFQASFAAHPDIVAWLRSARWVRTSLPPYTIGRRAPP